MICNNTCFKNSTKPTQAPVLHPLLLPSGAVGAAGVGAALPVVPVSAYRAPRVGDTVRGNKNDCFQPGILLPADCKALMSHCALLPPEVFWRGIVVYSDTCWRCLHGVCAPVGSFSVLIFLAVCVTLFSQNSRACCLVWIPWGRAGEAPG